MRAFDVLYTPTTARKQILLEVRVGSKSEVGSLERHVRSTLNRRRRRATAACPGLCQNPTHALQQQTYSILATTHAVYFSLGARCVVSENVVVSFGRHVASEAGLMQRLVARLSVLEVTESPAARRSVLF